MCLSSAVIERAAVFPLHLWCYDYDILISTQLIRQKQLSHWLFTSQSNEQQGDTHRPTYTNKTLSGLSLSLVFCCLYSIACPLYKFGGLINVTGNFLKYKWVIIYSVLSVGVFILWLLYLCPASYLYRATFHSLYFQPRHYCTRRAFASSTAVSAGIFSYTIIWAVIRCI